MNCTGQNGFTTNPLYRGNSENGLIQYWILYGTPHMSQDSIAGMNTWIDIYASLYTSQTEFYEVSVHATCNRKQIKYNAVHEDKEEPSSTKWNNITTMSPVTMNSYCIDPCDQPKFTLNALPGVPGKKHHYRIVDERPYRLDGMDTECNDSESNGSELKNGFALVHYNDDWTIDIEFLTFLDTVKRFNVNEDGLSAIRNELRPYDDEGQ